MPCRLLRRCRGWCRYLDDLTPTPPALPAGTSLRFAGRGLHCPEGISKQRNDEAECLRLCRQCPFPRHRGAPKYDSGKRSDRPGIASDSCCGNVRCSAGTKSTTWTRCNQLCSVDFLDVDFLPIDAMVGISDNTPQCVARKRDRR